MSHDLYTQVISIYVAILFIMFKAKHHTYHHICNLKYIPREVSLYSHLASSAENTHTNKQKMISKKKYKKCIHDWGHLNSTFLILERLKEIYFKVDWCAVTIRRMGNYIHHLSNTQVCMKVLGLTCPLLEYWFSGLSPTELSVFYVQKCQNTSKCWNFKVTDFSWSCSLILPYAL